MKESRHGIAYFLTNSNFIDWVKNPTSFNDLFWKKWLKNYPEDKEALYDAKAILERTNFKVAEISNIRKEEILDNILKNKTSSNYHKTIFFKRRFVRLIPWITVVTAASFLLFFGSGYFYKNFYIKGAVNSQSPAYMVTKHANKGEKITFYLPDSSVVTLNSESSLSYPSRFERKTREVTLMGEAYFDVRHDSDSKFMVNSGDIKTTVHGTAFNVDAYSERPISISLERGSVSVASGINETERKVFKIIPGEKLVVNKEFAKSTKSVFDFEEEFGWKEGILVFRDANLKTFVSILERWYDININVVGKSVSNWAVNGRFKNQSLINVLTSLEFSRNVSYKIDGNQVTLYLHNY